MQSRLGSCAAGSNRVFGNRRARSFCLKAPQIAPHRQKATEAKITPGSREEPARPSALPSASGAGTEPGLPPVVPTMSGDEEEVAVVCEAVVEVEDVLDMLDVMVLVEVAEAVEELVVVAVTVPVVETVKVVLERVSVDVEVDVGAEQMPHVRSHLPASGHVEQKRAEHKLDGQLVE